MHDPVVLITGATGGLGPTAAATFAADGARLGLAASNRDRLEQLAVDLALPDDRWTPALGDLRDPAAAQAAVAAVVDRFGRVDVLLHLVGGWAGGTAIVDLEPADRRGDARPAPVDDAQRHPSGPAGHDRARLGPDRGGLLPVRDEPGRERRVLRDREGRRGDPHPDDRARGRGDRRHGQPPRRQGDRSRPTPGSRRRRRRTPRGPRRRRSPPRCASSAPTRPGRSTARGSRSTVEARGRTSPG